MKASTWATIWPVITFAVGLASTQILEWSKIRRQARDARKARKYFVEDTQHEYELKSLTETLLALPVLVLDLTGFIDEAQQATPYSTSVVPPAISAAAVAQILKIQTIGAVVFQDTLRAEFDALSNQAVDVLTADDLATANQNFTTFKASTDGAVDHIGERVRALYAALKENADK